MKNTEQKHEVRTGNFQMFLVQAEDFFVDNVQKIAIGVAGFLLLLTLYFIVTGMMAGQREEASMYLNQRTDNYYQVISEPEPSIGSIEAAKEDLQEVIDKHGGSVAGQTAQLFLGTVYFKDGDLEAAEENFSAIADSGSTEFRKMAGISLSALQINKADYAAAAEMFERLAERSSGDQKRLFAFRSGELYSKLGNEEKARSMFELTRSARENDVLFQSPERQRLIESYLGSSIQQ